MGSKLSVLIVDDYPDALDVWEVFLRGAGYNVLTAANGPQALECAATAHPDVIVMDLELPGMSGFEVARQLRADAQTKAIPLIAATGYSHTAQLDQAHRSGFDAVLVKPCDPDLLLTTIRRFSPDHTQPTADGAESKPVS